MLNGLKKITFYLFLIVFFNEAYSQESLVNIEEEYKSKSYLAPDYYEVVARYAQILLVNNKIEESFSLLKKEYITAKKLNDFGNFAYLKSIESIQYSAIGQREKSKISFQEAKINSDKTSNFNNKGFVCYAGGWLAIRDNNEIEAVDYFLKALKYYDLDTDSRNTARRKSVIYHELAQIYADWNDYELQEKYTIKTLESALQQDNRDAIFSAYMAVGFMYEKQLYENPTNEKLRNLVEHNYLKAIKIYQENEMIYPSDFSYVTINLASLYIKYYPDSYKEKAREYALMAQKVVNVNDEPNYISSILEIFAEIALKENNKKEAKKQFIEALVVLEKSINKDTNVELSIYNKLIQLEIEEGNYKEAFNYQKKYLDVFKYTYDFEKLKHSKEIEAEYEKKLHKKELEKLQLLSDKKEQQIQLLNFQNLEKENQFNNLKLIEENQAKKLALSELTSQKKQQELKLAKLETFTKNKDLLNYQEKLSYREQINRFISLLLFRLY